MHILSVSALASLVICGHAFAEGERTFTDTNGAQYTILSERPFTDALKAQMVEIINGDSAILMEMGIDCVNEQYTYLGMVFDLPVKAQREEDTAKVIKYSNSLLTDRIGGLSLTVLDANLENDSVIRLFDLGCDRR